MVDNFYFQFSSHTKNIVSSLFEFREKSQESQMFIDELFGEYDLTLEHLGCNANDARFFSFKRTALDGSYKTHNDTHNSLILLPCIYIYHLAVIYAIRSSGAPWAKWTAASNGSLGHSVGLISAVVNAGSCELDDFIRNAHSGLRLVTCLTYHCGENYLNHFSSGDPSSNAFPMCSVSKAKYSVLSNALQSFHQDLDKPARVTIGLHNCDDINTFVGDTISLAGLRDYLITHNIIAANDWNTLDVTVPFHTPLHSGILGWIRDDVQFIDFGIESQQLLSPVFDTNDGHNLQHDSDIFSRLCQLVCCEMTNWPRVLSSVVESVSIEEKLHIIDLGPDALTKLFSQSCLRQAKRKFQFLKADADTLRQHLAGTSSQNLNRYLKRNQNMSDVNKKSKVIMFPGQGIQSVGMGAQVLKKYSEKVEHASQILGYNLEELCTTGMSGLIHQTEYTQPAIYFVNALNYLDFKETTHTEAAYFLGHSLGEINALHAAGAFDIFEGLMIVKKRGELMAKVSGGKMLAVKGMDEVQLQDLLIAFGFDEVYIANINTPSQIVLSGQADMLEELSLLLMSSGAKATTMLKTSGAFHCPFLSNIQQEFASHLDKFSFAKTLTPVIANCTARPYEVALTKRLLANQVTSPVRWAESIQYVLSQGDFDFIELGNTEILSRMLDDIQLQTVES